MSYRGMAAAAMAAAGLAAAGCGGSSDHTLSRSELVAKANAACKRLNAAHKTINVKTRQEYIDELNKSAREERLAFAELGKLKPPASLQSDWSTIVSGGQTLASNSAQLARYLGEYNRRAAHILLRSANSELHAMHAVSERDGLEDCAQLG